MLKCRYVSDFFFWNLAECVRFILGMFYRGTAEPHTSFHNITINSTWSAQFNINSVAPAADDCLLNNGVFTYWRARVTTTIRGTFYDPRYLPPTINCSDSMEMWPPTMAFSTMASPPIGSLRVRRRCPLSLLRSSVRGPPATINCPNSMEINCSNSMETWMANQQSTVFRWWLRRIGQYKQHKHNNPPTQTNLHQCIHQHHKRECKCIIDCIAWWCSGCNIQNATINHHCDDNDEQEAVKEWMEQTTARYGNMQQ